MANSTDYNWSNLVGLIFHNLHIHKLVGCKITHELRHAEQLSAASARVAELEQQLKNAGEHSAKVG